MLSSSVRWLSLGLLFAGGCSVINSADDFVAMDGGSADGDGAVGCVMDELCDAFDNAAPRCDIASGECVLGECNAGFDDCDGDASNGCELSVRDTANCGGCGVVCEGDTPFCDTSGTVGCVSDCPAASTACGDVCVDTTMDAMHCGGCDNACESVDGARPVCEASVCGFTCEAGRADCDGDPSNACEVMTATDAMNCGGCGTDCSTQIPGAVVACEASTCQLVECSPGFDDCDGDPSNGCEAVVSDDAENCGACGNACDAGEACGGGQCDPWNDVVMGSHHACAVRDSGLVDCWGLNINREYDPRTRTTWDTTVQPLVYDPDPPPPLSPLETDDFVPLRAGNLAVGAGVTCHIDDGQRLLCRGSNATRQAGNDVNGGYDRFVEVETDSGAAMPNVKLVRHKLNHGCAIDVDDQLWCWGRNTTSQVGAPTSVATTLARPMSMGAVRDVALTASNTCALLMDGSVRCVGWNNSGQLGTGSELIDPVTTSSPVVDESDAAIGDAERIFGGFDSFCVIRSGGQLSCWGYNGGYALKGEDGNVSRAIDIASDVQEVAMPYFSLCWWNTTGQASCQGLPSYAGFGNYDGPRDPLLMLTRMPHLDDLRGVRYSVNATCGFAPDGRLLCWGYSSHGVPLRDSLFEQLPAPVLGTDGMPLTDIIDLSLGANGSCVVRTDGRAYCYGASGSAHNGDNDNAPTVVADDARPARDLENVLAVARGIGPACAISDPVGGGDNELWCWGPSGGGSLPLEESLARVPTLATSVPNPIAIEMGSYHGCVISGAASDSTEGEVYCWGGNGDRQAGDSDASVIEPTRVMHEGVPLVARKLALGNDFTCAIQGGADDGQVVCWGNNRFGQLGNGMMNDSGFDPVDAQFDVAADIAAGQNHVCVIHETSRRVWCWGRGDYSQLGQGTNDSSSTPVVVDGPSENAVAIAGGELNTCAAFTNTAGAAGEVYCWGYAPNGALGIVAAGTRVQTPTSVGVMAHRLESSKLSQGFCAGAMIGGGPGMEYRCWGEDHYGRLGTDENVLAPMREVRR